MSYQICYASQTTSTPEQLMVDLREILTTAMHFNYVHKIQGVLYFADNYFFQCLEGEKEQVLKLLDSIKSDPRHSHFHILDEKFSEQVNFQNWSMKYVSKRSEIKSFFAEIGSETFNPFLLKADLLEKLLDILKDAEAETHA
ncbi:BLUF domain-containing protein [Acinetobacter guerrae]|uniref:BLUF domain-containing protein n=1 Tax=Acinetobacter guerrae TaxID=1843371 RepID=A0A3A8F516_9GAMM|nr:BLUF domain-containing protein [Acinetobacter guerrae]MPW44705.1 blue light sensor protein [Acinetobacter guerrae]RKG35833.1 BLUF domain-containing protein [Acinetobacter guerrae]